MKHNYYKLGLLLALWTLIQLASGQSLTITGRTPSRNAIVAPTSSNVALTFNQPLSTSITTLAGLRMFSAQRGGLLRNGQGGSASVSGNTLTFNPATNFRPGETVFVTGTTAIQSTGGTSLSRQVYQFTTQVGGTGRGNFTPPATNAEVGVGNAPNCVAVGDVDGDGDLDLVTANENSNTVSVRLNNGSGNFTAPTTNPEVRSVGSSPNCVVLGDVDGDGDLDLATANENSNTVSVRLNNGSGSFTPPATNAEVGVGSAPYSLAVGDLDGDGDLDLVISNRLSVTVSVRLNNGSGNFTPPATNAEVGVGGRPYGVALGDVDGDGDLDVLTASYTSDNVSVRLNNGSGSFTPPATNPEVSVGSGPNYVALGDLDGDGDLDLVTANINTGTVFNIGTVSVRLNNGSGSFTPPTTNPEVGVGSGPSCVAVGDVDGDGDLDLVISNRSSGTMSVRLNNGSGSFTPPATNPEVLRVGPLDKGQREAPDLNGIPPALQNHVPVGVVPGNMRMKGEIPPDPVTRSPLFVALGDVDGDGDLDMLTANSGNFTVSVRLNGPLSPTPTIAGLVASPSPACAGSSVSFTATVGSVTGTYNYTLTNGAGSTRQGTATAPAFNQSLTVTGLGGQSFTLTITTADGSTQASVPVTVNATSPDYQPLVDLYNSTGGANWTNKSGWLTGCSPCGWFGVSCDGNGQVTGLNLLGNKLAGTIPASISALTGLVSLEIGDNSGLTGGIPTGIGSLTALQKLNLSNTQLGGTMPASIGNLTRLANLYLNQSALTGSIPNSFFTLTSLQRVYMYSNRFSGSIPTSVSAMTGLRALDISENQLSGLIPTSLSKLTALVYLDLSNNQLSGPIPATLSEMTGLQYLLLNNNQLSGCFPASLSALCGKNTDFANNPNLPGGGNFAAFCASRAGSDAFQAMATASPNPACVGSLVSLSATAGTSYQWSGPGGFTATTQTPSLTATSSGLYSVTVGNGSPSCSAIASVSLTVSSQMTASLGSNGTLSCAHTSVTLTASGGVSYAFAGPGITSQSGNTAVVNAAGMYSVTVTSANGCTAVASTNVSGDQSVPTVSISANPSLTITQGQTTTLTANVSGDTPPFGFGWSTGASDNNIVATTNGPYSVTVTGASGCSASASVTVSVNPVVSGPFAITGVTTVSCDPILPNRFSVSFNPRYQGLNGQPVSFSVTNELLPTTQPGPFTLQLYADNPTITLNAVQSEVRSSFVYNWLAACNSATTPNTPPWVVMGIPAQTATVGSYFSYVIPDGTFTDDQTPGSLKLSAAGVPAGLAFSGATLSGTPSSTVGSPVSISITATDPGGLWASTPLVLTVQPATGTPPPTAPFAITGVTTLSCTPVANRININFAPRYAGMSGQPIAFEVVNELAPTTDPAPYSLTLYRDNPTITLRASQTGSPGPVSFSYNWLAACSSLGQENTPPRLNEPVQAQSATVGVGYSLNLVNTFTDQETPDQISLSASGLPGGLSLSGTMISGTPSMSGVSSVTLTATDGGGLSTSTTFNITVSSGAPMPPPSGTFSITGVTTMSCEVISAGQRRLTFTPRYGGDNGTPISFSVVNEMVPTTNPGPYTLSLYTDNPAITLSAVQKGVESRFGYSWLSACNPGARVSAPGEMSLSVTVLGNPVSGERLTVEVRGAEGQRLQLSLSDQRGQLVGEQLVERAGSVERQVLWLSRQPAGILLLRVSTSSQHQTVKVLKVD